METRQNREDKLYFLESNSDSEWEKIFSYGERLAKKYNLTEDDVNEEINKYREEYLERV